MKKSDKKFAGVAIVDSKRKVTLLPIFPVVIRANDKCVETFAQLNGGSEITMVCEQMKEQLGLIGCPETAQIGTWHASDSSFKTARVAIKVAARDGSNKSQLTDWYTVYSLHPKKRPVRLSKKLVQRWPHLAIIPIAQKSAEVMILIGSDHIDTHDILWFRVDPELSSPFSDGASLVKSAVHWSSRFTIGSQLLKMLDCSSLWTTSFFSTTSVLFRTPNRP